VSRPRATPDPPVEREQRVTPLELFFDLVVVFAMTEVTQLMASDLTWRGLGRGMLALAAIWWSWTGYAWLTNNLEPEHGLVRAGMFAAMAAMFVVALAVPRAFGTEGVLFGVAYLVVRLINTALYAVAKKGGPDLGRAVARLVPSTIVGPALILVAGSVDGAARTVLWVVALVVIYGGGLLGLGPGWRASSAHLAERYGLIVIIALGESVISLGVGAGHVTLSPGLLTASVLGILVIAGLWWAYFDVIAVLGQRELEAAADESRARLARDLYTYLHLPMIAGIVLFALGLEQTIVHLDASLDAVPAVALLGGLSLYYLAHVAQRIRLVAFIRHTRDEAPAWIGPGRLVAGLAMLALIPVALVAPALLSLALAMSVCWGLIAWDLIHYREDRVEVRRDRP
jgi:low temperature requirement protein LtrA